jgi:hypothetical protein
MSGCCLAIRKLAGDAKTLDASPDIDCDQRLPSGLGCLPDGLGCKSPSVYYALEMLII